MAGLGRLRNHLSCRQATAIGLSIGMNRKFDQSPTFGGQIPPFSIIAMRHFTLAARAIRKTGWAAYYELLSKNATYRVRVASTTDTASLSLYIYRVRVASTTDTAFLSLYIPSTRSFYDGHGFSFSHRAPLWLHGPLEILPVPKT